MSLENVIGMLCLDIAGTLVHDVKADGTVEISEERYVHEDTINLLKRISEGGVLVVPVSGMRRSSFEKVLRKIPLNYGIIEHGGVILTETGKHDPEWREFLRQDITDVQLYKAAVKEAFGTYAHIEKVLIDDGRFTTFRLQPYMESDVFVDYPIERIARTLERVNLNIVHSEKRRRLSVKIDRNYTFWVTNGVEILVHVPHPPHHDCFEIVPKKAGKSNAIEFLGKRYGIGWDRIAAGGDDLNDIGMLALAGYAFTFGSAKSEVRNVVNSRAGYITEKTAHEGTIDALNHFLEEALPRMRASA